MPEEKAVYRLWIAHPVHMPVPMPYTAGSLPHCRAEQKPYKRWGYHTGIYPKGVAPQGLRDAMWALIKDNAEAVLKRWVPAATIIGWLPASAEEAK